METRGSVGAGNAITPEEVAEADLVIVAADIEVDGEIRRQADVPHHHRSGAEENRPELDKAVAEAKPYQPSGKPQAAAEGKRVGGRLSPPADRRLLYAADGSGRGLCIALSFAFGIKAFEVKRHRRRR